MVNTFSKIFSSICLVVMTELASFGLQGFPMQSKGPMYFWIFILFTQQAEGWCGSTSPLASDPDHHAQSHQVLRISFELGAIATIQCILGLLMRQFLFLLFGISPLLDCLPALSVLRSKGGLGPYWFLVTPLILSNKDEALVLYVSMSDSRYNNQFTILIFLSLQ